MTKTKKAKRFYVDIHWDVARGFEVTAKSKEEAERKVMEMVDLGQVDVWRDGFEATDDVTVVCSGEENKKGEICFY